MSENQTKLLQGNRAIIQAKYLQLLGEFRANPRDVRYYLQGIYIEPHEDQGAYLCATDGHRFVVIHDEEAEIDAPMLVNIDKIIFGQSKKATLADFDGQCVDLQDEEERFMLRAPAPLIEANYPDWRSLIPQGEIKCEPGAIDPALMAAISKAPFTDRDRSAYIYTRQDKPCIVRFPSLPEIFVLVMPMLSQLATGTNPKWVKRKKSTPQPQQSGFELVGAGEAEEDETPVADNADGIPNS